MNFSRRSPKRQDKKKKIAQKVLHVFFKNESLRFSENKAPRTGLEKPQKFGNKEPLNSPRIFGNRTPTPVPQLCVQLQQLQVEGGQDSSQGKVPLCLPEIAFVVGIAVAQRRGCPERALC